MSEAQFAWNGSSPAQELLTGFLSKMSQKKRKQAPKKINIPKGVDTKESFLISPTPSPKEARRSNGTIINAVPLAELMDTSTAIQELDGSAVEQQLAELMDTSPSEMFASPKSYDSKRLSLASLALEQYPRKPYTQPTQNSNKPKSSKVGVWSNGVLLWDDTTSDEDRLKTTKGQHITGTATRGATKTETDNRRRRPKPNLSVQIPGSQRPNPATMVVPLAQPKPLRRTASVAPAGMLSKFAVVPPAASTQEDWSMIHPALRPRKHKKQDSRTSSSDDSPVEQHDSGSSVYSRATSATSVESRENSPAANKRDSKTEDSLHINKPLPPSPLPSVTVDSPTLGQKGVVGKITKSRASKQSLREFDILDNEFIRSSPYAGELAPPKVVSPTLSQAERELQSKLSAIAESPANNSSSKLSLQRNSSVRSVMHPSEKAPALPKRSRKREWRRTGPASQVAHVRKSDKLERRKSGSDAHGNLKEERKTPLHKSMSVDELFSSPYVQLNPWSDLLEHKHPSIHLDTTSASGADSSDAQESSLEQQSPLSSAIAAEDVLLRILEELGSLQDLFSTAIINKGMYRIYQENDMRLVRTVLFNQSPAAWEFREWCPTSRETTSRRISSDSEYTPSSYLSNYKNDLAVIESLKALIYKKCETFIRSETAAALSDPMHPNATRFTDALWRIWCFCIIFGRTKEREDDITGQLDWLKGGSVANNQGCAATVNTNLELDMSNLLLNAPDHFAKGNPDGLNAEQLYDMTELWTCLSSLLQGYHSRTEQAQDHGVFANSEIAPGDTDKQASHLEEWTFHLLTLGPRCILSMAQLASDPSPAGFALAAQQGWTTWTPPHPSFSRATFLKAPVARLYEERMTPNTSPLHGTFERELKALSRKHIATLAAEIRLQRQTTHYRVSLQQQQAQQQRAFHGRAGSGDTVRADGLDDRYNGSRFSYSPTPQSLSPTTSSHSVVPRPLTLARQPSAHPALQRVDARYPAAVEAKSNRAQLASYAGGVAENTSDRAVMRIVEMGFTPQEAKDALRRTDKGSGLRVDHAVDWLMRR